MARWQLIASTLVISAIVGSSQALSADLTVQVKGISTGGGKIVLDLWRNGDHAQYFPDFGKVPAGKTNGKTGAGSCDWAPGKTTLCRQSTAAAGTSISYTFKGLPKGSYAVSVFHDKDESWDANPAPPFGIPKEGYESLG